MVEQTTHSFPDSSDDNPQLRRRFIFLLLPHHRPHLLPYDHHQGPPHLLRPPLRQLSWLWLLRFHKLTASVAWLTDSSISLIRTANRRISSHHRSASTYSSRLYKIIRLFLILVLLLIFLKLLTYRHGWQLTPPSVESAETLVERL
ncbi:unnamed protein product [Linum trigynum]|uniref:Uncharacterized protein n=1 Tax=Linum trigynum TaxID=586398 RepID=A0AAV2CE34_9ROSI